MPPKVVPMNDEKLRVTEYFMDYRGEGVGTDQDIIDAYRQVDFFPAVFPGGQPVAPVVNLYPPRPARTPFVDPDPDYTDQFLFLKQVPELEDPANVQFDGGPDNVSSPRSQLELG